MADEGRGGVVIPGYQPVERVGKSPSFGAWIRAVQTRLDRRVLLKVLPDAKTDPKGYFTREIQTLVQLDGKGVLRVIDEGTAGPVRYLVVDEADCVPLPAEAPEWTDLAGVVEDLYRRVGEYGQVLLPIPPEAWRRLPSGHYAAADLGFVIPYGQPIPAVSTIPTELAGKPAEAWMNACFLGLALRRLSEQHPGCPRALRQVVASLERHSAGRANDPDPLAAKPVSSVLSAGGSKVPLLVGGAVLALLLVLGIWLGPRLGGSPDSPGGEGLLRDENGTTVGEADVDPGSGTEGRTEPETSNGGDATDDTDPVAEQQQRELAASARFTEIMGNLDSDEDDAKEELPNILDAAREEQLAVFTERFDGTKASKRASLWLKCSNIYSEKEAWDWWHRVRPSLLEHVAAGQFATAETVLRAAPRRALPGALSEEMRVVEGELQRSEAAVRAARDLSWKGLREARRYSEALAEIASLAPLLTEVGRAWAKDWQGRLSEESARYQKAQQGLAAAEEAALGATEKGDFAAGVTRFEAAATPAEFPQLRARNDAWQAWLGRAQKIAESVGRGLSDLQSQKKSLNFEFVEDGTVRGRVTSIDDPTTFTLKVDNRRELRSAAWRTLELETLSELEKRGGGGATAGDIELLLFCLGELSRSVEAARSLEPAPDWLSEAARVEDKQRRHELAGILQKGDELLVAKKSNELKDVYEAFRTLATSEEFSAERERLTAWLTEHWRGLGPEAVFEGASERSFEDGVLTLEYDFREKGADADWQRGDRRSKIEPKKGALLIRGSVWLAPTEAWKTQAIGVDVFAGSLRADAELQSTDSAIPPNLNLVLFAGSPSANRDRGVLFGLGFQPRRLNQINYDGEVMLLPANVIGPAKQLESGRNAEYAQITPKVPPRRAVHVEVAAEGDNCSMQWKSRKECSNPLPEAARKGTVQFRTYDSPVVVRRITVQGSINPAWWDAWVRHHVAATLDE